MTYSKNPATSVELQSSEVAAMAARMTQRKALRADQRSTADMLGLLVALRDATETAPPSGGRVAEAHANALEHAKGRALVDL